MDIVLVMDVLVSLGLSKSESSVYLFLLGKGYSTPKEISEGIGIQRTNCYDILYTLVEKRFVLVKTEGKKKVYGPEKPSQLLEYINDQKKEVEKVLPMLEAAYTLENQKPSVMFYSGFEEVKKIYNKSLEADTIYAIGSTKSISDTEDVFLHDYLKKVKAHKIKFNDLITGESLKQGKKAKKLLGDVYDVRILPVEYNDQSTDILVWDNNVAFITLGDLPFGTVLENESMANTFRAIFQTVYQSSKFI